MQPVEVIVTRNGAARSAAREYKETVLQLLPKQGSWSEEEYLALTDNSNRLVEYTDGYLEVLPMPTDKHQAILDFFLEAFKAYIVPKGGKVRFSPLRLRIREGKYREPDLLLLKSAKDPRRQNRFWTGADLVLEVVSKDKPERDLIDKVDDYAEGGVPEYWIANPQTRTVTVLKLKGKAYLEHGVFAAGEDATSVILKGFSITVDEAFEAD